MSGLPFFIRKIQGEGRISGSLISKTHGPKFGSWGFVFPTTVGMYPGVRPSLVYHVGISKNMLAILGLEFFVQCELQTDLFRDKWSTGERIK